MTKLERNAKEGETGHIKKRIEAEKGEKGSGSLWCTPGSQTNVIREEDRR